MITRQNYIDKPTNEIARNAIQDLKKKAFKTNSSKIEVPKIASGLYGRAGLACD